MLYDDDDDGNEDDGRNGNVQTDTTSPMPNHKGFKLQKIHPRHFLVNFHKFSTLWVNKSILQ